MNKGRAINLAIKALKKERSKFAVGYNTYQDGYSAPWAERHYKRYNELSEAILIMKDEGLGGK